MTLVDNVHLSMQARVYYRRNKLDVHEDIMLADGQVEIQEVSQMMPV